jgi:hypothetical protein
MNCETLKALLSNWLKTSKFSSLVSKHDLDGRALILLSDDRPLLLQLGFSLGAACSIISRISELKERENLRSTVNVAIKMEGENNLLDRPGSPNAASHFPLFSGMRAIV